MNTSVKGNNVLPGNSNGKDNLFSTRKPIITITILIFIIIFLLVFSYKGYRESEKMNQNIDSSIEMYTAQVSDSFRRFEYDDVLVEGLYYFNAYASLSENGDLYGISSRLVRYTELEIFSELQFEDAVYIADFLDLLYSAQTPTSDEVLEFFNYIALVAHR